VICLAECPDIAVYVSTASVQRYPVVYLDVNSGKDSTAYLASCRACLVHSASHAGLCIRTAGQSGATY
jgi:hypothetical protein